MDALFGWFDLGGSAGPIATAGTSGVPLLQQLLLYGTVVLGVLLSEAVAMARAGGPVSVDLSRPWLAIACIVALIVFPAVWREIGSMPDAGLIVQMGLAAQGGVFWGVIVAGAEKGSARRAVDPAG